MDQLLPVLVEFLRHPPGWITAAVFVILSAWVFSHLFRFVEPALATPNGIVFVLEVLGTLFIGFGFVHAFMESSGSAGSDYGDSVKWYNLPLTYGLFLLVFILISLGFYLLFRILTEPDLRNTKAGSR